MSMSKPNDGIKRAVKLAVRVLTGALLMLAPTLPATAAGPTHLTVSTKAMGATQTIALEVNKSIIVDMPANVGEVIVSQPSVAAVIMRTKTRAIVQGVAGGDTNVFFLDARGSTISVLDIKVYQPRSDVGNALEAAIARNIPGSRIKVESVILDNSTNRIVLSGTAASQDDVSQAIAMAAQFAGSGENVASIVSVSGNQQVKLKVTVAEVNRDTIKQLGINLDGSITIGAVTLGLKNTPANGLVSGVANTNGMDASVAIGPFSLDASLRALERRGSLRTLAEPTLTAMSGQAAEFLVGGEFPYQTSDNGNPTVEFKQYGVTLNFTPTVKSNGQILLLIDTSVSEPSGSGALTKRSAKTTVELPSGSTLAIAGMLQDSVRQQINALPGLGDIPILGALFRSRDFIRAQTELVILVTPYLAESGAAPALPTDGFIVAGDAEAIFLGHMETMYGVGGDAGPDGSYDGSVGFVLD